jgi:hypothetical protein
MYLALYFVIARKIFEHPQCGDSLIEDGSVPSNSANIHYDPRHNDCWLRHIQSLRRKIEKTAHALPLSRRRFIMQDALEVILSWQSDGEGLRRFTEARQSR